MLFVVEERLEGFKYNIALGGGGGYKGGGDKERSVHYQKKGHSQHFCPSLQFKLIRIRDVFRRIEND